MIWPLMLTIFSLALDRLFDQFSFEPLSMTFNFFELVVHSRYLPLKTAILHINLIFGHIIQTC